MSLNKGDLSNLALIGPTAGQVDAIPTFGECSPGMPEREIGSLEALQRLVLDAKVTFAVADNMTGQMIDASLFTHDEMPGLVWTEASGKTTVDASIDVTKINGRSCDRVSARCWPCVQGALFP